MLIKTLFRKDFTDEPSIKKRTLLREFIIKKITTKL